MFQIHARMNKSESWKRQYTGIGLKKRLINAYTHYIDSIDTTKYPIIFEFNHLSKLLGMTPAYLASVINSTENHYRIFSIPKRNKKEVREIQAPYPALLECQKWINRSILSNIPIHSAAHGYISKKSIKTNAKEHLAQKSLLKIDLKNFFPSININRVINVFQRCGYADNVSFYLARICCYDNRLPQGAATSPYLSNVIAFTLDKRLHNMAEKLNLNYTRYADDLSFSGDKITWKAVDYISRIAEDCGFEINTSKTLLISKQNKKIVTGLSVSGDQVKIPKKYKRKLRQELHFIMSYGYLSHISNRKIRNPYYLDSVYGKYTFWKSIEPDNLFIQKYDSRLTEMVNYLRS